MRLKPNIFKWSMKMRLIVLGVLIFFISILAFVSSDIGHAFVDKIKDVGKTMYAKTEWRFTEKEVVWNFQTHYTSDAEIDRAVGITVGESMDKVDLKEIQQRLEKLPWVRSCVVERYIPDKLKISIIERMPIAIWQNHKQYHPLDELAEPIQTNKKMPSDLLLVVGEHAPQHLLSLLAALMEVPDINQYVRSAIWVGDRRWTLKLFDAEKGVEIILPEGEIADTLLRLDAADKKEKLIRRKIKAIDMRQADKIIIRPLEEKKKTQRGKKK